MGSSKISEQEESACHCEDKGEEGRGGVGVEVTVNMALC